MSGDAYRIAVNIALASNHVGILGGLSSQLMHIHGQVNRLHDGFSRLKLAMVGGLAAMGGAATLGALGKMVDKGNELVKVQQNMAAAGVKAAEVQEAYAKAWELTAKYKNVGASEALKVISEARMTFGSQHDATHHAEDFVKMISFLKAFQGGKHGGGAADFEREAIAAMKSGEIAGKVTPAEMSEHVKQLTAMRIAYGDQLKIQQYLTAQRAAGVALRNTSDDFRYGMFPALVQENGPGAGVMLMTAFNKIVAGTGNRQKSLEHMVGIGLLKEDMITRDKKTGKVTGLKDPAGIQNSHDAAINFGDWVMKTLKPKLDAQTTDPIRQAQLISAMFPDRNAAKAITEIIQQYGKLSKDAALMREARNALNEGKYVDQSWDGQKQALETQWNNFLEALGAPAVGHAAAMLAKVNNAISDFAQWAAREEHAEAVTSIFKGLAVAGAALVGAGSAALLAALGPAGWLVGGITALVGGFAASNPEGFMAALKSIRDGVAYAYGIARDFATDPKVVGRVTELFRGIQAVGSAVSVAFKDYVVETGLLNRAADFIKSLGSSVAIITRDAMSYFVDNEVVEKFKVFYLRLGTAAGEIVSSLKGIAPDPETLRPMKETIFAIAEMVKSAAEAFGRTMGDPKSVASIKGTFVTTIDEIKGLYEWYREILSWRQKLQDMIFGAVKGALGGKDLKPDLGIDWNGDVMGQITTKWLIEPIKGMVKAIGDAGKQLADEIASWPGKLAEAISSMGAAIVAKIKEALGSLFGGLFNRTSLEGGEGGFGGMIHKASLGGGMGSDGLSSALVRGGGGTVVPRGGAGPGTGTGDSWYEAVMRAEGTSGKDPYNVVLGNGRYGLPSKPLTEMTLAEAYSFGRSVLRRHGSSSALGAFQIVGRTMREHMKHTGLGWGDKFSPENQRALAESIRRREGWGAWEGLKKHRGELERARQGKPLAPAPPTAGPPPKQPQMMQANLQVNLDGRKVASSVTRHIAEASRFPAHVGGMDTYGSWRPPGTTLADAA